MVSTEILDEALRGGEPARALEQRCLQRLHAAEDAVRNAIDTAPVYLAETLERHQSLLSEADSLNTQLEMLGESLDDVTRRSQELAERSKRDTQKRAALDDLAVAIVPFVKIADALEQSDNLSDLSIPDLQRTILTLEGAIAISVDSQKPQLLNIIPELEERADGATAIIKARFMDTFEVHPNSIVARGTFARPGGYPPSEIGEAAAALAKAGMLGDVMSGIVAELKRNDVATHLSQATVFFQSDVGDGCTLEWAVAKENSSELLEFDFDDIENISDDEVDAMSDHLDISNTAARVLKVYDVLRHYVVGTDYSRELAFAMQPWLSDDVLPSSIVTSSGRLEFANEGVPRSALRSRATAVSASARVLQLALRSRGVSSFVLVVEMDSLEGKVGSECRAQAILTARRAITNFANAWHDDSEIVACPVSASIYIPRQQRPPDYFAPCLVTKSAISVHDVFLSTRRDALNAIQGGSTGIGSALNSAAVECLRAYREDVPVQHANELRASLRLKALYYNDCMMLSHSCRISLTSGGETNEMTEEIDRLEEAAQKAMMVVRRTAEQRLVENLNAACRNGGLGAYGTLIRIQRGSALSAAFNAMREVVKVFADVVPTELAELAAGRLLDKYLNILLSAVVALPEISADGCEQIDAILRDADNNVNMLMELVKGMEVVRAGAPPPEVITQMRTSQRRLQVMQEILRARMEEIVTGYRSGKYQGLITRQEVEHFILAIFEDTPLRASFISDLDVSLEQEQGEWGNSNW